MNRTIYFWGGLSIAVIAYAALSLSKNTTNAVQALIALPGSGGLLFALWELLKDNIEHQHRLDEKSEENAFILSATSHMAQTAFDKHVQFCEEYIGKVHKGLSKLFRCGPTPEALEVAADLYTTRQNYIVWETGEVTELLDKFEQAWRNMGADKMLLEDLPTGEERTKTVKKIYDVFNKITTYKDVSGSPTPEIAIANIIAALRKHLGVTELTNLRQYYLDEAIKRKG